jgi:hypothetical protein
VKRAEDCVRLALLGPDVAELVDCIETGVVNGFDPSGLKSRAAKRPPLTAEGADLAREVNGVGAGLLCDRDEFPLGLAMADDQARASLAQRCVELGKALEKKLGSRARRVAAVKQAIVEAEDRDDALVAVKRRAQGGMVADPEVATKPDDAGPASGHGMNLPGSGPWYARLGL